MSLSIKPLIWTHQKLLGSWSSFPFVEIVDPQTEWDTVYESELRAHVQGALNTAIDKGSLDLKIFDVDYEPDMEIDGEVLGELEEVKCAAAAQALLQASYDKKRRSAFYPKQSHPAPCT